MKNITRKGFTLIELLIVMVVIAVLSSMMLLSSLEATYTAEANNIIVGLVQIKKAFNMWCMDHPDSFDQMITRVKDDDKEKRLKIVFGNTNIGYNQAPRFWNEVMSYLQKPSEPNPKERNHYYQQLSSFRFWVGDGDITGKVQENTGLYVVYNITGKTIEKRKIVAKLAGRAKSVGLLGSKKMDTGTNIIYSGTQGQELQYVLYRLF